MARNPTGFKNCPRMDPSELYYLSCIYQTPIPRVITYPANPTIPLKLKWFYNCWKTNVLEKLMKNHMFVAHYQLWRVQKVSRV